MLNNWKNEGVKDLSTPKIFITLILLIQMFSTLVFLVLDILLFYVSFEAILIPMFFLVGFFGSRNKKLEANYLLFLYTLFGSLFLLLAIITLILKSGTSDYEALLTMSIDPSQQNILWLGFF